MDGSTGTLILGIGNILWADEGFGVRAADYLHSSWDYDDSVTIMDGGTQGIYLLQHVEDADLLVIFDAIDYGLEPGTLKLVEGADVPSYMGAKKVSLHQTGFQEVLAMAEMLGRSPRELLLVGVQPKRLEDYGGSLHEIVRRQIEPAAEAAVDWLAQRDIQLTRRDRPRPETESIAGHEIDMQRYEAERPDATEACRVGDDRVLSSDQFRLAPRQAPSGSVSVDVDHRGKY